jgi:PAS domain S-box-containing protein
MTRRIADAHERVWMSTILIAYERELEQNAVERLLTERGHTVVRASNGVEALDAARREPPQLIVSDILLPKMDGISLCKKWKQDERLQYIPFMFYTKRHDDSKYQRFASELGVDRYIERSSEPMLFLKAIDELLEQGASVPRVDTARLRAMSTGAFLASSQRTGAYTATGTYTNTGTFNRTGSQAAAAPVSAVATATVEAPAPAVMAPTDPTSTGVIAQPGSAESALTTALAREQRLLARINEIDAANKQLKTSEARLREQLESTEKTNTQIADCYQTLLIAAADGYWLLDEQEKLLDVNEAYCRMSGYSKEELLKLTAADLELHIGAEHKLRLQTHRDPDSHEPALYESRHKRSDGSEYAVEVSVGTLTGARQRTVAIVRDISAREQRTAEAQRAQQIKAQALQAALELYAKADELDDHGIARRATELAAALTSSPISFFCVPDAKQMAPRLHAVFDATNGHAVAVNGDARALDATGAVANAMRAGSVLMSDTAKASETHSHLPEQHSTLLLPIVDGSETLALLAVANRAPAYAAADREVLQPIVDALSHLLRAKRAHEQTLIAAQRAEAALQGLIKGVSSRAERH